MVMQTSPVALDPIPALSLICLVVAAAFVDLRERRIPNRLTYPFALAGIALNGLSGHWLHGILGLGFGLGATGGLALLVPGALGMGDVKMMAAIGAIAGAVFAAHALLWGVICGGVLAVVVMAWRRRLAELLRRTWRLLQAVIVAARSGQRVQGRGGESDTDDALPFALALALGTIWELWRGVA
jgi:prepilin peptidase CpaA